MTYIVAQAVGIVAMLFNILSFQCKRNERLLLMLGAGSLLFSTNFMLLGAYASAGFNIVHIFRSVFVIGKKTHNNIMFALICGLYIAVAVFAFDNWWTIILLCAQIAPTYALWYKDGATIRKVQTLFVSPVWLINNIFMAFSIGGIVCEVFSIMSVVISFIRYGKDGFEA